MPESGIKINGKLYPIPQSLRVGETRTIKKITGLNPPEFMQALNDLNETQDPDVGAAMVWWVVHREDPKFGIEQIDDLEWGQIESQGDEDEVVDPKAVGELSGSSPISAEGSSVTSEQDAGELTHANGGAPALVPFGQPT